MYKIILLFFCAFLMLLDLQPAQAEEVSSPGVEAVTAIEAAPLPRPNYKRYRGNSRTRSRRMGFLRRRAARRKAMRNKKATVAPRPRKGVISVDPPKGSMPKK